MIRINLLGQERPKAPRPSIPLESTLRTIMLLVSIGLALIVLVVIYHQKSQELTNIETQIHSLQAEKTRLQQTKAEVQKYEQDKTVLQQRINVIETLQANRSGGQKLLEMVANTVGRTSQLWLTQMDRKGNDLDIRGESGSINAIADFLTQMKRSGYFDKIEIKDATENDLVKGVQSFAFSMTAEVIQPKPASETTPPAPARPGKS